MPFNATSFIKYIPSKWKCPYSNDWPLNCIYVKNNYEFLYIHKNVLWHPLKICNTYTVNEHGIQNSLVSCQNNLWHQYLDFSGVLSQLHRNLYLYKKSRSFNHKFLIISPEIFCFLLLSWLQLLWITFSTSLSFNARPQTGFKQWRKTIK